MKKKPRTEAEVRAEAVEKAAEREAKSIAHAKSVYENMWKQFAEDWKKGKALAYTNLLSNLTFWASDLVPAYMTAKEHMAMIAEATEHAKRDGASAHEDPRQLISSWLRGDSELSRIPLEKQVA